MEGNGAARVRLPILCLSVLMTAARLLLLTACVAAGCGVDGRVEAEIEAALPTALGPADSYEATVSGVSLRAGTLETVQVLGRRVAREDAPVIDRLDATLRDVAFDRGSRELTRVGSTAATARLLPRDLADYLSGQRGVGSAEVSLSAPDRVNVRVRGQIGEVTVPATATVEGRLTAQGGQVLLDVERVSALGISLGARVARTVEAEVNPVADFTDEDLELRVESVSVDGSALVVEMTGDLSGLRLRR